MSDNNVAAVEFSREDYRKSIIDAIVVMVNRNGGLHTGRYKNLRFRLFTMLCTIPDGMSARSMNEKVDAVTLDDLQRVPDSMMIELFEYATYRSYTQR